MIGKLFLYCIQFRKLVTHTPKQKITHQTKTTIVQYMMTNVVNKTVNQMRSFFTFLVRASNYFVIEAIHN